MHTICVPMPTDVVDVVALLKYVIGTPAVNLLRTIMIPMDAEDRKLNVYVSVEVIWLVASYLHLDRVITIRIPIVKDNRTQEVQTPING